MAKRYIGIDLEGIDVRVAILTAGAGTVDVKLDKREYNSPEEAVTAINEMLGGEPALNDRIVTALPGRVGLFRRLRFPFREKGKIEAALPLELSSQLPVELEEHLISFLPPRARENDYEVDAVVVHYGEIEALLEHFPEAEHHPRRIDFFPFALLPALADREGLLIYCRRLEVVVALVYDGIIWDYRLLPGTAESSEEEVLDFIGNQVSQLENAINADNLPLWVIGAGVTEKIHQQLQQSNREILFPGKDIFTADLPCEMAPAALLALVEMRHGKAEQLNFRKGEFAARGQLEIFRSRVIVAAIMLLIVLAGGAATMHLGYLQKTQQEAALKEQLKTVFRQTMPSSATIVDVPLQLESQLQELQKQVQLFGLGGQGAATVMQSLSSRISKEVPIDLREFSYSSEEVRMDGHTDSFDSVNKVAEALRSSPLFETVEISDAKLATEDNQVDFELRLKLYGGGGGQ